MISNEKNPSTEVGFENAVCRNVPVFARFRESGRTQAGAGPVYRVAAFNYGLLHAHARRRWATSTRASAPRRSRRCRRRWLGRSAPLPPMTDWVNVHTLGVKGDGQTDDTAAIQAAVNAHRVLYFPSGFYVVRDTIP